MPRLTNSDYLINRHLLIEVWEQHWGQLAELPTFAQRDLHRFYAMSKDLSDDQAIALRKDATAQEPSLSQQAGRAFAQLETVMSAALARNQSPPADAIRTGTRGKHRVGTIRVRALARPEIDYERLARALVEHAMYEIEKAKSAEKD